MPHVVPFGREKYSEISPREGCDLTPRRKQSLIHFFLGNGHLHNQGAKWRLSIARRQDPNASNPISTCRDLLLTLQSELAESLFWHSPKSLSALRAVTVCRVYITIPYLVSFLSNAAKVLCIISVICQLVWILNASRDLELYMEYAMKFKKKLFDAVNNRVLMSLLKLTNHSYVYRVLLNAGHKFILRVILLVYVFVYMFIYLECSKWSRLLPFRRFPFRGTWRPQHTPTTLPRHTHAHTQPHEATATLGNWPKQTLAWPKDSLLDSVKTVACTKMPFLFNVRISYTWKLGKDIWSSWSSGTVRAEGKFALKRLILPGRVKL